MRACSGTWIAHGSGSADRDVVDRHDRIAVPPDDPAYQLRRVWLTRRKKSAATTTASPTKDCGRCATSRTCVRRSAPRTGHSIERVNASSPDAVVGRSAEPPIRSCSSRTITSRCCRAWSARAAAARDDHHVLAHPVAESGSIRDLPVARRAARRTARQQHPRIPHAVPLQQFRRYRRSPARSARRPRDVHRVVPRRRRRR